ncbi:MAG: hypothetical protein NVSMB47_16050 [Polyangiales bacterium]
MSNVAAPHRAIRAIRAVRIVGVGLVTAVAVLSCKGSSQSDAPCAAPTTDKTGNSTQATEWVGYHTEVPIAAADFHPLAAGLFGPDAQAGKPIVEKELTKGVFVEALADKSTPDQVQLAFSFDDGGPFRRKLATAPASFAVGNVFLAAADAALAKMQADNAAKPKSGETFLIEYRVVSSQGGRLSFGVKGDFGKYSLVLDISTPKTSLKTDAIGKAADKTQPFDTVAGTVWFHNSKDDFDYFVDHAYGKGSTGRQNFHDFALVPHEWLRLTVDPHLDKQFVDVGFEVLATDGKRISFAKAPASVLAGKTFQTMVDRSMETSIAQEKDKPGSATPWMVPFYYDAPVDGGVVQVIAEGKAGVFDIAYAVESPRHVLRDVDFLQYAPVDFPPEDPLAKATCDKLGDPSIVLADKGTLDMTFTASDVVKNSPDLKFPLKGKIACSIFAAQDVTVAGPKKDAVSVQDFAIDNADLTGAGPAPKFVSQVLHAGEYQVLCAMDVSGRGSAGPGDPVTLPIGTYPVACNKNPITVEFAILYPKS